MASSCWKLDVAYKYHSSEQIVRQAPTGKQQRQCMYILYPQLSVCLSQEVSTPESESTSVRARCRRRRRSPLAYTDRPFPRRKNTAQLRLFRQSRTLFRKSGTKNEDRNLFCFILMECTRTSTNDDQRTQSKQPENVPPPPSYLPAPSASVGSVSSLWLCLAVDDDDVLLLLLLLLPPLSGRELIRHH